MIRCSDSITGGDYETAYPGRGDRTGRSDRPRLRAAAPVRAHAHWTLVRGSHDHGHHGDGDLDDHGSGNQWVSGGIFHLRNQTQSGPVTGDITGTVTVTGRSDVTVADMTGTGSG